MSWQIFLGLFHKSHLILCILFQDIGQSPGLDQDQEREAEEGVGLVLDDTQDLEGLGQGPKDEGQDQGHFQNHLDVGQGQGQQLAGEEGHALDQGQFKLKYLSMVKYVYLKEQGLFVSTNPRGLPYCRHLDMHRVNESMLFFISDVPELILFLVGMTELLLYLITYA